MVELVETIITQMQTFAVDARTQATKDNKAAGVRARKLALAIRKNLIEFGKQSLAKSKGERV